MDFFGSYVPWGLREFAVATPEERGALANWMLEILPRTEESLRPDLAPDFVKAAGSIMHELQLWSKTLRRLERQAQNSRPERWAVLDQVDAVLADMASSIDARLQKIELLVQEYRMSLEG